MKAHTSLISQENPALLLMLQLLGTTTPKGEKVVCNRSFSSSTLLLHVEFKVSGYTQGMQVGKLFIGNFKKFQGIQNMTIRS